MVPLANKNKRTDIQGLRAISVLLVVAYHAGLRLPGGFFGVDIFFVISGFVITASLKREYEQSGQIKLRSFYFRRFKRLAPSLALVVFLVMAITPFLLTPLDAKLSTATTGMAAIFSISNVSLVFGQLNYFAPSAKSNLLLHTWSLSVEEQIYVVFPIFLSLIFKLRKSGKIIHLYIIFGAISVSSYFLSIFGDQQRPAFFGHYSPIVRIWAFLAGAMLAIGPIAITRANVKMSALYGYTGLLMILAAALFVNSASSSYKTFAIFPVAGAAMIIISGLEPSNKFSLLISNKLFLRIGDASYAIYLWHWPIIAITREVISNNTFALLIAAVLSFVPAILSFQHVESPLKSMTIHNTINKVKFVSIVTLIPLVSAISIRQLSPTFFDPRFSVGDLKVIHEGDTDRSPFYEKIGEYSGCKPKTIEESAPVFVTKQKLKITRCKQSRNDKAQELALIGDSHAESLFPGLAELLPNNNVVYFTQTPTEKTLFSGSRFENIKTHILNEESIKIVIISYSINERKVPIDLTLLISDLIDKEKIIYVSEDVPKFSFEPAQCKFNRWLINSTRCAQSAHENHIVDENSLRSLRKLTGSFPNVKMIRPASYLCSNNHCSMNFGNQLLFHDNSHLNLYGSRFIGKKILAEFQQIAQSLK